MDYYSVLGVDKNATPEEIKKSFRKLAMLHHPDKGGEALKFQQINEAYETLSNPIKKAEYDNPISSHNNFFGFSSNPFDLNDVFSKFYEQNSQYRKEPYQIYRTQISVSLVEAFQGVTRVLQINTPSGQKVINVVIPKGVKTGDQIRYDNIIDNAKLIIQFTVTPDLRFDRRGNDLYMNLPISVLDLIVGTKVKVNTIDNKTLEVTIPPKTQPTQQIKITGMGMPASNGTYGDQILLFKPFVPDNVNQDIIDSIIKYRS